MKSRATIVRELRRIRDNLKTYEGRDFAEQYGAQQALLWAMGDNAMAPSEISKPQ